MVESQAHRRFCGIAQKWQQLAERRRAHFAELYHSGLWQRYYTEADFRRRAQEVAELAARWAEIAPPPVVEVEPRADEGSHRSAA